MDFEQLIGDLLKAKALLKEDAGVDSTELRHVQRPLAFVLSQAGRTHESLEVMKEVAYVSLETEGRDSITTREDFVSALEFAKALNDLVEALAIYREIEKLPEPEVLSLEQRVAFKTEGAYLHERLAEPEKAEVYAREALYLANSSTDWEMHRHRLKAIHILANVVCEQRKFDDACEYRRQELVLMEASLGEEHPGLLPIIDKLIEHLATARRMDEVAVLAKRKRYLKWGV